MCTVAVTIPDAVLYDTNMTFEDAQSFARRMTATGLYERGNVSLGYCAQVANMTEADFILYLGSRGISIFNYRNEEELALDVENALLAAGDAYGE